MKSALTPSTLMCVGPETQTGHQAYMGKWHYQLSHLSGPIHLFLKDILLLIMCTSVLEYGFVHMSSVFEEVSRGL